MDSTNAISSWAGGGATTTLGAAQLAYGLYKQKKNKRPNYEIPAEILANMTQADHMAYQGLPEEQKQQYINNLQRSQAYSLNQASSRKAGLTGLAAVNQQGIDAYSDLMADDAAARRQNQTLQMQQRQVLADYRDKQKELNEYNKYYEDTAQNQAMIGAGMQNVSQGLQSGNTGSVDWGKRSKEVDTDNGAALGLAYGGMKGTTPNYQYRKTSDRNKRGLQSDRGTDKYGNEIETYPYGGQVGGTEDNYAAEDATWSGVGKMGAIGGVIGGVANLGNAVGRPVRSKNESVNEQTGQLQDYKTHKTIGGGLLNPLAALQTRGSYKGGWTDVDGSGYKSHLKTKALDDFRANQQQWKAEEDARTAQKYGSMLAEAYPEKYNEANPFVSNTFAMGGLVGDKKIIEIETKEVVKNPDNSVYVGKNNPTHKNGGKKMVAGLGAKVFTHRELVPGTKMTFAEMAAKIKNDPAKMDELFAVQEWNKKQKGLNSMMG
jgi:hypothetical protein